MDSNPGLLHNIFFDGSHDIEENISAVIYLASTTDNNISQYEVDTASRMFSSSFKIIFRNNLEAFENLFNELNNSPSISLTNYRVNIADPWLFQVILLNSIKYSDVLPLNHKQVSSDETKPLSCLVEHILKLLNPLKQKSLYLLKTLQLILSRSDILTSDLSLRILKTMSKISLSPINCFKLFAQGVSKIAVQYLPSSQFREIFNPLCLPERGIEICDVLKLYSDEYIKANTEVLVKRVLRMFLTNIENKDGGFLYERLLICTFDEWKTTMWPLFYKELRHIEYEGEFYQSLVKYWIPSSIAAYHTYFYMFLKGEPIDIKLRAVVLLETIKKGYQLKDVNQYFYNIDTASIGLRMIATHHKKSLNPQKTYFDMVMQYLYSNINCSLEDEEVKSINLFFSHMCLYAHNDLRKSDENFHVYRYYVDTVYKFCLGSLNTEFFEVGAQILLIIWNCLSGSSKNLALCYKIEKKDHYEKGNNSFYMKLIDKKLWKFENQEIIDRLKDCFMKNEGFSLFLTNLIHKHYPLHNFVNTETFKDILEKVGDNPTIQNTEKIINCSNILFKVGKTEETLKFIEYIKQSLLEKFGSPHQDKVLFRMVLYLEILTFARRHEFDVKNLEELIEKSLKTIEFLLEKDVLRSFNYTSTKIFETFISRVIFCMAQDMNHLWPKLNKEYAMEILIKIIQKSNLKKPVSLSVDILRQFGVKMEENEVDKILKIKLIKGTLQAMFDVPQKQHLKIRRNPESRLVIHAMCLSIKNTNKIYLDWVLNTLLEVLKDQNSSDYTISSALHTIEILISDNRLQYQTQQFIPEIIVQCVELFGKPSWIVRNADLQLTKALIERIYGVSMNTLKRPKNIEDLFTLYPQLSMFFFKILSADVLEERAVIVLQFFSESQIKERLFRSEVSKILEYFQVLFIRIIKSYENHYGVLAVRSYVSLCSAKYIPGVISDLTVFISRNFVRIRKNILSNLTSLIKELCAKYKQSFESEIDPRGMKKIHFYLNQFATAMEEHESDIFDYLLLKIRSKERVLRCLDDESYLGNRLWLHNNIPFLVINTKPSDICAVLEKVIFKNIPNFMEVKILSILLSKYENDIFSVNEQQNIVGVLFNRVLVSGEMTNHTLMCYFKVILVFMRNIGDFTLDLHISPVESQNLYKTMINVLYVSVNNQLPLNLVQDLYSSFEHQYFRSISTNEEIDNDLASTLVFYNQKIPRTFDLGLSKMVVYFSLFGSTYQEIYYFISSQTGESYLSILDALRVFLSIDNLSKFIRNKNDLKLFLVSVSRYLNEKCRKAKGDEFYAVEGDEVVPKRFVSEILNKTIVHGYRKIKDDE